MIYWLPICDSSGVGRGLKKLYIIHCALYIVHWKRVLSIACVIAISRLAGLNIPQRGDLLITIERKTFFPNPDSTVMIH